MTANLNPVTRAAAKTPDEFADSRASDWRVPTTRIAYHKYIGGLITRATAKAISASENRDNLIRQAHASGVTIRAIAAAAGLSPARIHQILHGR
jgi:hypothetical protein